MFIPYLPIEGLHDFNLDWFLKKFRELSEEWDTTKAAWLALKEYVETFFDNLDVQEEINAKIDDMIEAGTFSTLLWQLIDQFTIPQVVNSTSLMTNHQRIYILSSNQHIYAYNGTEFYDTGMIYGEGKGTLMTSNVLIAPSTLSSLTFDDINDIDKNKIYTLSYSDSGEYISHMPPIKSNSVLISFAYSDTSPTGILQLCVDSTRIYTRRKWGDTWSNWNIEGLASYQYFTDINNPPNLNDLPPNKTYVIASGVLPEDAPPLLNSAASVYFKTDYTETDSENDAGRLEFFISNNFLSYRQRVGSTISKWTPVFNIKHNPYTDNSITDLNDLTPGVYAVNLTDTNTDNLPYSPCIGIIIAFADTSPAGVQIFIDNNTKNIYWRYKWNSTFSNWDIFKFGAYNLNNNPVVSDLNNATQNANYALPATSNIANNPSNNNFGGVLSTLNGSFNSDITVNQFLIDRNNHIWFRVKYSTNYSAWMGYAEMGYACYMNDCIRKPLNFNNNSHLIIFGDSIAAGSSLATPQGNRWSDKFTAKIGCTSSNYAVGGASVIKHENYSTLIEQINNVTDEDWRQATHVFIGIGVNDAGYNTDLSTLRNTFNTALSTIRTKKPGIHIIYISPIHRNGNNTIDYLKYSSILFNEAIRRSCSVINGYNIPIPVNDTEYYMKLLSDNLHPTNQGHTVYADYLSTVLF